MPGHRRSIRPVNFSAELGAFSQYIPARNNGRLGAGGRRRLRRREGLTRTSRMPTFSSSPSRMYRSGNTPLRTIVDCRKERSVQLPCCLSESHIFPGVDYRRGTPGSRQQSQPPPIKIFALVSSGKPRAFANTVSLARRPRLLGYVPRRIGSGISQPSGLERAKAFA